MVPILTFLDFTALNEPNFHQQRVTWPEQTSLVSGTQNP